MPTADELAEQFLKRQKKEKSADDLAAEFMARRPKASTSADDLAEQFLANRQPAEKRPTGLALLAPPKSMGYTKEKAAATVKTAQAEDKQRRTAESVARKSPQEPSGSHVDLTSPRDLVRRNPEMAKGGPVKQLKEGVAAAVGAVSAGAAPLVNRLGAPLYPVRDFLNVLADEHGKVADKHAGALPFDVQKQVVLRALQRARPWEAFKKGAVEAKSTEFEVFQKLVKHDKGLQARLKSLHLSPAVLDFIASIPVDALSGKIQSGVVGTAEKLVKGGEVTVPLIKKTIKGVNVQAKAEAKIPALGRTMASRRAYQEVGREFSKAEVKQGPLLREVADNLERERALSQRLMKKGAKIRVEEKDTGRVTNVATRFVADVQEAGAPKSRFSVKQPGPSLQKQQKQLQAAEQVLPKRGKLAAQAAQKAEAAKTELATVGSTSKQAQQRLLAERKAAQQAAETARKAREQAQAAQRQAAVAEAAKRERMDTLAGLRNRQKPVAPGVLQAARQRVNTAVQKADAATAEAKALQGQAKAAWSNSRLAQQPVTAATREAGKAQQQLFTTQKLATKAEKQAERLAQRAAGAQMKVGVLGAETSLPATRAGIAARRVAELKLIRQDAARYGITPEDMGEIEEIAKTWQGISERYGQGLVDAGRLSKESFERLRGVHLPRLYALRAAKPKEAERYLKTLEKQGKISAEEALNIRSQIDQQVRGVGGGKADFTKARDVEDTFQRYDPSVGRIAEGSSSVAMSRYATSASREIAEAEAHRAIVANPELARPWGQGPSHWKTPLEVDGVKYQIDPGVRNYLNMRKNDEVIYAAIRSRSPAIADGWRAVNQTMRKLWMSAPPSAINNASGNYSLGAGGAAMNGANYSLPGYVARAREFANRGKGALPQRLDEFLNKTGLAEEGAGVIPRRAREVGSGFGVETTADRLKRLPGDFLKGETKLQEGYSDFMLRDPEASAKYYLFWELREAGKSIEEAERITRAVMIDYSDVGWFKKMLDQNNILPFLTFPTKAIFQYMNLAARRPDLFQTWTGERLRDLMDQLSDESAVRQGKKPTAKARREAGAAGITSFPIPGQFDSQGQPLYMRSGALAPIAMMAPFGRPDEAMDPLQFATERYNTSVPLVRAFGESISNYNTFLKKPIVEPGAIPGVLDGIRDAPGNPEAMGAFALDFAKRFVPQVGQAERLYHGLTGTTAFPGPSAPKQTLGQALLQNFTGAAVREGLADMGDEKANRRGAVADNPKHLPYVKFGNDYEEEINKRRVRDPARVKDAAQIKTLGKGLEILKKIKQNYKDVLNSDYFTGDTKKRKIRERLDWLYAVADRVDELERQQAGAAP